MSKLDQSLSELDQSLRRIREHFLFSDELADRVILALNNDATVHSDRLEPDSSSAAALAKLERAWNYATEHFEGQLTPGLIAEIARIIHPDKGVYRTNMAMVEGRLKQYVMTNPAKVAREVDRLLVHINQAESQHPAFTAAELHLYFAIIHPLGDGNGRTARLLQNLYLYEHSVPPVIIKHTERLTYLNHIEDALIGFRERSGQENMFEHRSHGEYRFFEYIVDKIKGSTERLATKVGSLKKYEITADIKGPARRIYGLRNALRTTLSSMGIPPQIDVDMENSKLTVISSAPEVSIVGITERYKAKVPFL